MVQEKTLTLIPMTTEQAKEFAGKYGMNAIIVTDDLGMVLVRCENEGNKLIAKHNSNYGIRTFTVTDNMELYWIGRPY